MSRGVSIGIENQAVEASGGGVMRIISDDSLSRRRLHLPYFRAASLHSLPSFVSLNLQRPQNTEQQKSQRSPDTSSVTQPLTIPTGKHKLFQQQLFLFLHARKCTRTGNQSKCALPNCSSMRHMLSHITTCPIGKSCSVSQCSSLKEVLVHWNNCRNNPCHTCSLLKKAADRRHKQPSTNALTHDLQGLLLSGDDSDIKIEVQGEIFKAHRAIIKSRSPVFAAMFKHNMQENSSSIVKVSDCDPETFRNFLQCIYTGRVDNLLFNDAINLYRVADKYDLMDLKDICVNLMEEKLSVDTACDVILLADMHNDIMLKYFALEFLVANMKKVICTSIWGTFMAENSALAAMILETAFLRVTSS